MINYIRSQRTAISIGVAMGKACASGNLEEAESLFESYRHLFDDYQERGDAHTSA